MDDSQIFELSIASLSKPFPYSALATAMYINSKSKNESTPNKTPPIAITTQSVALLQLGNAAINAKLIRKKE